MRRKDAQTLHVAYREDRKPEGMRFDEWVDLIISEENSGNFLALVGISPMFRAGRLFGLTSGDDDSQTPNVRTDADYSPGRKNRRTTPT